MKVLLVTTWGTACGIAEHSAYLKAAVEAADPSIEIIPSAEKLDPIVARRGDGTHYDLLHLNYHRALHSRWTPIDVADWTDVGYPVVITFHDTYGEREPDALSRDLHDLADAFVVHEPVEGLPRAIYWRQGVPAAETPYQFGMAGVPGPGGNCFKQFQQQPVIGSVGFPFPWKNYDLLAEASFEAGCALLLIAPGATEEQIATWRRLNPWSCIRSDFVARHEVVGLLSGCDATAFLYQNGNSGTSAAIRMGIAARKPIIAFGGQRQFRDLEVGGSPIRWQADGSLKVVTRGITAVLDYPMWGGMTALAEQDGWRRLGERYARLYRSAVAP